MDNTKNLQATKSIALVQNPVTILKNLSYFNKIKNFEKVGHLVIPICNKHAVLSGIDKEIDQFTKEEIAKYTALHLQNLTFEEIEIAFQNERFNLYNKKSIHYNFFSIDYFVEVITKYKDWKREQMTIHNISLVPNLLPITSNQNHQQDIKNIRKEFINMLFNELQTTQQEYMHEAFTLYEDFISCGLINVTDDEKKAIYQVMKKEVIKENTIEMHKSSNKTFKKELKVSIDNIIKSNKDAVVINKSKAYLVCRAIKEHQTADAVLKKLNFEK